jgi:hypothetical protein
VRRGLTEDMEKPHLEKLWHLLDDSTVAMNNENERIKLRATFWNNLAVAAITGGIGIPS